MSFTAKNTDDSYKIFNDRKDYKEDAFPDNFGPKPLDMWYYKPLYGKVDRKGSASFLSETNLKQITADETIFAVDFVVDAFRDFNDYYKQAIIQKKINIQSKKLKQLKPTKGWESLGLTFHEYMNMFYDVFIQVGIRATGREYEIQNFDDFMKFLMYFIQDYGYKAPITRSGFIYSRYCSPMISGLIIELKQENHGKDEIKKKDYIDDDNFQFYRRVARKFGFVVDKNAPWRLIANVATEPMQDYMRRYGVTYKPGSASDLFEVYYYQAYLLDIDFLKTYILQFYNSYVNAFPYAKKILPRTTGKETKSQLIQRTPLTIEEVNGNYDNSYWLQKYFEIRKIETRKKWESSVFTHKIKRALDINKSLDFSKSLEYIDNQIKIDE